MITLTKRRVAIGLPVVVLLVGASIWGAVALNRSNASSLPREFSVEALKADAKSPGQVFERVHEAFRDPNLTDEQRRQLRENVHQVFEEVMDKQLDEYFTASADQRQVVLDRHIDEMVKRRAEMEKRRAERGDQPSDRQGRPDRPGRSQQQGPTAGANQAPQAGGEGRPGGGRDGRGGPPGGGQHTRQEHKERSESRDPDRMARRMAYFAAVRQRAEQRGIDLPMRGPGGPGGFGGGPGGPPR